MDDDMQAPYWEVPVLDTVLMRERKHVVRAVDGEVVMISPPGEGCVVPKGAEELLINALGAARSVADLQRQQATRQRRAES